MKKKLAAMSNHVARASRPWLMIKNMGETPMLRIKQAAFILALMLFLSARQGEAALNVKTFGAKGDGSTDDTAAIQEALDACFNRQAGAVMLPAGKYNVKGHLSVPAGVRLEGIFQTPPAHVKGPNGVDGGSILLATEGKGHEEGTAFITLHTMSQILGLEVFYPEQTKQIIPYPWCVRGDGDNCTIANCLLINPYQGVDFGNQAAGRHFINGLYGQPLKTGLLIDQCYDVGRVSNVHFWPFWKDDKTIEDWTNAHGVAFVIARTDWEYMNNCFCISYSTGYHFLDRGHGPGNAILSDCGSDTSPLSVKIDALQQHAGVSFVNGQFMGGVIVSKTNTGPVKFTSCGFWGVQGMTDSHAIIDGAGTVFFTACHFISWGQKNASAACIHATGGNLIVNGCEFLDSGKNDVDLDPAVESAVVMGCRFRSKPQIIDNTKGDVQIGLNVVGR